MVLFLISTSITQGMVDGSASKPALRQDTGINTGNAEGVGR